jgi:RNA polymerase sigma factor for flagellar operon FliA
MRRSIQSEAVPAMVNRPLQTMDTLGQEEEHGLWRRLREEGDLSAREAILIHYLPFAKILAAKVYSGRHHDEFEFGEYVQYATIGLLESVSRFDPARGVKFKTFAGRRIIGSILNGLEHLSEKQQQISFRQRMAAERLHSIRGRQPDGSNPDELFSYLAQVAVGLALGYILEDSGMYQKRNGSYMNNGYEAVETEQLQERMRSMVEKLPERERMVVKYHYMNHVPFEEIADMLCVTKGRISQIHKHAIDLLRQAMKEVRSCDVAW